MSLNAPEDVERTSPLLEKPVLRLKTRSFSDRAFGKLTPGSLRGSIFTIITTAIGAGALSLPYIVSQLGFVLGVFMLFLGGLATIWSLNLIVEVSLLSGESDYAKMCAAVLGSRALNFARVLQVLFLFGGCVSFIIIIGQLSVFVIANSDTGLSQEFLDSKLLLAIVCFIANYVFIVPLGFMENLHSFRYISLLGFMGIIYVAVLLLVQLPQQVEENYSPEKPKAFIFSFFHILQGFSLCLFSYACSNHILPVYNELQRPSKQRIEKVIKRSSMSMFLVYAVISLAGYFSTYDKTPKLVLERRNKDGKIEGTILIGIVWIICLLIIHSPLGYFPCKSIISQFFGYTKVCKRQNVAITFTFFTLAMLIAIVYPKIVKVAGILGGFCAVTQAFVLPLLMFRKLRKNEKKTFTDRFNLVVGVSVAVMGYTSTLLIIAANFDPRIENL